MNKEDALGTISLLKSIKAILNLSEYSKRCIDNTIEAVEKSVAEPVRYADWSVIYEGGCVDYRCPACGGPLGYRDDYCKHCGKAIDWEAKD